MVTKQKGETPDEWAGRIKSGVPNSEQRDFSNVIVLGSGAVSGYFEKNFIAEKRPFIAEINPENLNAAKKEAGKEYCVKIMKMLSIATELASGKDLTGFDERRELDGYLDAEYIKSLRKIVFFPKAVLMDVEELKTSYELDRKTLVMA